MKRGSLCGGYHNPLTMPSDGYAFYWGDTYWGSMVTRPGRAPEQRNVLICAVPSDTHDDLWIEVSADSIAAFGSRLKDQGEHVSPGFQLGSYSTQLVATASLRRPTPGTVVTQLTDVLSGTPYTASPVTSDRTHSTAEAPSGWTSTCRDGAEEALSWLKWITEKLGRSLNEAKTCVRDARGESFDFLGYTFAPMIYRRTGQTYLGVAPSKKRVKRFKQSLRTVLHAGNHAPLGEVMEKVNRKLQGWGQYFSIGTLEPAYRTLDRYSSALLRKFLVRRHKVPGRGTRQFGYRYLYEDLGLVRLQDRRQVSRSHALA